jgi:ribulose 1,5-bisphosphate synthetase/thiazole synthase
MVTPLSRTLMKSSAHSLGDQNIMANGLDVAIIGAGPYGLSCSAYLRGREIEHVIVGSPMAAWRDRLSQHLARPRHHA